MPGGIEKEGSWSGGSGIECGPPGKWIGPELGGMAVVGVGLMELVGAEKEKGRGKRSEQGSTAN